MAKAKGDFELSVDDQKHIQRKRSKFRQHAIRREQLYESMSNIFNSRRVARECTDEILFLRNTVFILLRQSKINPSHISHYVNSFQVLLNDIISPKSLRWFLHYLFIFGLDAICDSDATIQLAETISRRQLKSLHPKRKLKHLRRIIFFTQAIKEAYDPAYREEHGYSIKLEDGLDEEALKENCQKLRAIIEKYGYHRIRLNGACMVTGRNIKHLL